MKKRKFVYLLTGTIILICSLLLLYAYTPVFVSNAPLDEFPASMNQATSVQFTLHCSDVAVYNKEIQNRFAVQSMAKDIIAAIGEETEFVPESLDGGFALRIEFYRKDELVCELWWSDHLTVDLSRYRLHLVDGEISQWYILNDPELMQGYVAKVHPEYAAAFWK